MHGWRWAAVAVALSAGSAQAENESQQGKQSNPISMAPCPEAPGFYQPPNDTENAKQRRTKPMVLQRWNIRSFNEGTLTTRQCHADVIRYKLSSSELQYRELNIRVGELSRLYAARGGRQQVWMDTASAATMFGTAGVIAGTAAQIGDKSLRYWGYAALAPVVISQINAYEPTRDLFNGASLGMDLISTRYNVFIKADNDFADYVATHVYRPDCLRLDAEEGRIRKLKSGSADQAPLLQEVQRLEKLCTDLATDADLLDRYKYAASRLDDKALVAAYASDVLKLDANVVQRDEQLRFTPFQTLTGIAAAPLNTASALITGSNPREALDQLKTQATFNGLTMELRSIKLPSRASTPTGVVALADAIAVRNKAKDADVVAIVTGMASSSRQIEAARQEMAYSSGLADQVDLAVVADQLTFNYDATTKMLQVVLGAKPSDAPKLAQSGAASK